MALPDFVIIGAMKCGTTTLQEQLAAQPGVFMSTPKEPNFFSDDDVFFRGRAWYEALFDGAAPGDLKGEASTHYTKLPTYPHCVDRLAQAIPHAKLVYMIRNPLDRLVSHYIHEWSMGVIRTDLSTALDRHPELVDYGRYGMQIAPWLERFPRESICLTSLERLRADPPGELARIGAFLGLPQPPVWQEEHAQANVSAERVRRFPLYGLLIESAAMTWARRTFVPKALRTRIREGLQMRGRPALGEGEIARLTPIFLDDRTELERLFPETASGGTASLAASYLFAGR